MAVLQFPSHENLAHGQNDDAILGGSIAINRMLLSIMDWAKKDTNGPRTTCVLINAYSLFECNYKPDMALNEVVRLLKQDVNFLAQYLDIYFSHYNIMGFVPIVLYVPNYQAIPTEVRREVSDKVKDMNAKYLSFIKTQMPQSPVMTSQGQSIRLHVVPVGKSTYPHIELASWVQNHLIQDTQTFHRRGNNTYIVTHCLLDLHITRRLSSVSLWERYTAAIKQPNQFGTKLIKEGTVPFNIATHRAFGDPVHIEPMAVRKTKTELLKVAEKNKWMLKSYSTIVTDISRTLQKPIGEITKYNW